MERNGFQRILKIIGGKLWCDCLDSVYTGAPCRHTIMLANTQREIKFEQLPINSRWRLDYFKEEENKEDEEKEKEKKAEENTRKVNFVK